MKNINKSLSFKQVKYLIVILLLFGTLLYSSCTNAEKDEILEMETILNENEGVTEGKYFDLKEGKTFVGENLEGKPVSLENYTTTEKEMYDRYKSIPSPIFEYSVVIDTNGERVHFIKTTKLSADYKNDWTYVDGEDVPFARIENVPVYPGCKGTQEELRECLTNNITEYVGSNFNKDVTKGLGLEPGKKRIFVLFKINEDGAISMVKARAPHILLENEAIRVIKSLPRMIPGKYDGKNVSVKYSLPINFNVK